MKFHLLVREEAEDDLRRAFEWYEARRDGLGDEFLLCVEAVFQSIRRQPALYAVVHRTVRRALCRRFPYGIFYVIAGDAVVVLAVLNCQRDPSEWRGRA